MISATIVYFIILTFISYFLGMYIKKIYADEEIRYLYRIYILEQFIIRKFKLDTQQNAKQYLLSLLSFNLVAMTFTFLIIYYQDFLSFYSFKSNISFSAALNATISFNTNSFWQSHNPEQDLSMFSHIFALTLQNFLAPGSSFAVFIAFIRGVKQSSDSRMGNFYADLLKSQIYILIPGAFLIAVFLISQSVPHAFMGSLEYYDFIGNVQRLLIAPVAGQVAIKTFASNGGSIFSVASAHPFETPSELVVIFLLFVILSLPLALIFTYGKFVNNMRLSWALYLLIIIILSIEIILIYNFETNYSFGYFIENRTLKDNFNIFGKELIFEKFANITWIILTTMGSFGSANAFIESFSPMSILILLSNMLIGKFTLDGIGSGVLTMLIYMLVAIFIRGLILGQTPTFARKKIGVEEINYVIILLLLFPIGVLCFTSLTLMLPVARESIFTHGPLAITEIAFNFSSALSNNGAAMKGIITNNDYFEYSMALAMLVGRYGTIIPALMIAGSLAQKQQLFKRKFHKTSGLAFAVFLFFLIILTGAITFMPILLLGPFLEFVSVFNM